MAAKSAQLFGARWVKRDRPTQNVPVLLRRTGRRPSQGHNEEAVRPGPPPFCFARPQPSEGADHRT